MTLSFPWSSPFFILMKINEVKGSNPRHEPEPEYHNMKHVSNIRSDRTTKEGRYNEEAELTKKKTEEDIEVMKSC